jgi:hypothetical protein
MMETFCENYFYFNRMLLPAKTVISITVRKKVPSPESDCFGRVSFGHLGKGIGFDGLASDLSAPKGVANNERRRGGAFFRRQRKRREGRISNGHKIP